MPKLFETKSTNINKDNKKTDKVVKKSLLNTSPLKEDKKKKVKEDVTKEIKKRGRPPKNKIIEEVQPKQITKPTISKPIPQNQLSSTQQRRWHNFFTNPPEQERPLEFHTDYKKPVYGYKTYKGIITNNPYYIDIYKHNTANIEWQYINSCKDLSKCPNGFPDCEYCDIFKKLNTANKKK